MTENLIEGAATESAVEAVNEGENTAAPIMVGDNMFDSLGLGDVDADPNAIPDGRYDAVVASADMVHIKSKNSAAIVFNYQVEGDYAPARIAQFQNLGNNVVLNDDGKTIKSFTPTMSTQNKQFLKKAFVDLGIPESTINTTPTLDLLAMVVGRKCTIGVKKNGAYRNVSYVEYRAPEVSVDVQDVNVTVTDTSTVPATEEPPF
jgi:hypothetical protein